MTTTDNTPTLTSFQVGSSYFMRSPCDHNCIWAYTVISRTAKRLQLQEKGKSTVKSFGIQVYDNVERCSPIGKYSMSPVLSADREV